MRIETLAELLAIVNTYHYTNPKKDEWISEIKKEIAKQKEDKDNAGQH